MKCSKRDSEENFMWNAGEKKLRACLGPDDCTAVFLTTASRRLCPRCAAHVNNMYDFECITGKFSELGED
jgi:hypothetical protein